MATKTDEEKAAEARAKAEAAAQKDADAAAKALNEAKDPAAKADAEAKIADPDGNIQEAMDAEQEQGFRGTKVDPTPNHAYTVAGVTEGEPTPETDPALRAAARSRAFGELEGGQTSVTEEREPGQGK